MSMLIFKQGDEMVAKGRGGGKTPQRVMELLQKAVEASGQVAVANATGLARLTVQRYLKGVGEPSSATLEKLADYFEVHVVWLQGHFENMPYEKAKEYRKVKDSGKKSGWVGDVVAPDKGSIWGREDALDVLWSISAEFMTSFIEKHPKATKEEIKKYILGKKPQIFVEAAKRLRKLEE